MMITETLIRDIIKYVEAGLLKLLKIPKAAFTDNKYIFLVGLLALLSVLYREAGNVRSGCFSGYPVLPVRKESIPPGIRQ